MRKLATVEPVLKDHPIGHKNVFFQDRWSLMAMVSQYAFHCSGKISMHLFQGL